MFCTACGIGREVDLLDPERVDDQGDQKFEDVRHKLHGEGPAGGLRSHRKEERITGTAGNFHPGQRHDCEYRSHRQYR